MNGPEFPALRPGAPEFRFANDLPPGA